MKALLTVLLCLTSFACASGPQQGAAPAPANDFAASLGLSLHTMAVGEFGLHYADSGEPGMPTVVMIHGTPGSWRSLSRLFDNPALQGKLRLVSIDRPGWGGSPLPQKVTEGVFGEQVKLILPLLKRLQEQADGEPIILVGHSYGGSIAPYIAYQHPDLVDGLVMASSAIDPVLGKPRWYNYAASVWPISVIIDDRLIKANIEIWGVANALKELEPWWPTVKIPMVYIQGEEDELVHPGNLEFAENHLPAANTRVVRIPGQGHLTHRQQSGLIAEMVLEVLSQLN
ncbi:MAG: alpha/beta hydrolase [Gammaproteobacteria bacterium]